MSIFQEFFQERVKPIFSDFYGYANCSVVMGQNFREKLKSFRGEMA